MIPSELTAKYYAVKTRVKHMGKNKKDKLFHTVVWNDSMSRRDFLNEYAEADAKACGLFLCKVEFNDFTEDRYWDVPEYRAEAVKSYRGRIKTIRTKYGLSQSEVAAFMAV